MHNEFTIAFVGRGEQRNVTKKINKLKLYNVKYLGAPWKIHSNKYKQLSLFIFVVQDMSRHRNEEEKSIMHDEANICVISDKMSSN